MPWQCDPTAVRLCGALIASGDIVVFDHGELTHLRCHDQRTGDLADQILEYLNSHPSEDFCHTCLSLQLNCAHDLVQKAVVRMRTSAEVTVRVGTCGLCQRPRVTVRARSIGRGRERRL